MSKFVKSLITDHVHNRLNSVKDALLVNVVGMDAITNHRLRNELAAKNINLLMVKNSLAARAMAGTPLAGMFEGVTGTTAVCWGSEDIVSLAKQITTLIKSDKFKPLEARGGVMGGEQLSPAQVAEVSKWPSRTEQLSLLVGQILSPGAQLGEPVELRRRRVGQPDSTAGGRGRRRAARRKGHGRDGRSESRGDGRSKRGRRGGGGEGRGNDGSKGRRHGGIAIQSAEIDKTPFHQYH